MSGWPMALVILAASNGGSVSPFVHATAEEWRAARAEVSALRVAAAAGEPSVTMVHVRVAAAGGFGFEGRGAMAVAPGRAMRLILVGPAGRTMLDWWADRTRSVLRMPDENGELRPLSDRALALTHGPLDFLRQAVLTPYDGRLLAAGRQGGERVLVFAREGGAAVAMRVDADGRRALVTGRANREYRILATGRGPVPAPGDLVSISGPTYGVQITVRLGERSEAPPEAEAFRAPDEETP